MIHRDTLFFLLGTTLSFTGLSLFTLGLAAFTIYHALAALCISVFIATAMFRSARFRSPELFWILVVYVCVVNAAHANTMKITSFIYTVVVLLELLLLYNLTQHVTRDKIDRVFRTIVVIYTANIVIASLFLLVNYMPQGSLGWIFRVYDYDRRIRPYAFSDEPSYAATLLVFCAYVFASHDGFRLLRARMGWYFSIVLAVLLTGSAYGYMLLLILFTYLAIKSGVLTRTAAKVLKSREFSVLDMLLIIVVPLILVILLIASGDFEGNRSVQRLVTLYREISSSDENLLSTIRKTAYVDGSASLRLVPSVRLIDNIRHLPAGSVIFGFGAAQSIPFFSSFYAGHLTVLGFIPAFLFNYGFVGFILFFVFFIRLLPKRKLIFLLLFVPFLLNADFNTQIFQFVLFCAMCARKVSAEATVADDKN